MEIEPLEYIIVVDASYTNRNKTKSTRSEIFFPPDGDSLLINGINNGRLIRRLGQEWNHYKDELSNDQFLSYPTLVEYIYRSGHIAINGHYTNGQRRNRTNLFSLIDKSNTILRLAGWQICFETRPKELYVGFDKVA